MSVVLFMVACMILMGITDSLEAVVVHRYKRTHNKRDYRKLF